MKALTWILAAAGISVVIYLIVNAPATEYAGGSPDVDDAADSVSNWGSKQRLTGTGGSLVGKAKEGVGNLTGNDQLAGEGVVDQAVGTVKDAAGKAAHAVSDTVQNLNK